MAINKNFVVRHGLEVNTNLILANADTKRVGIGSTVPKYTLDVRGGIGVTDIYAVGISTVLTEFNVGTGGTALTVLDAGLVGVGTPSPAYLLDVRSSVSTGQTALYVYGDAKVTGNINLDGDINIDEINARNLNVTGLSTFAGITTVTGPTLFTKQLNVSGVSTFVGFSTFNDYVDIQDGLRVSGVSTFAGITTVTGETLFTKQLNSSGVVTASAYYIDGTSVINNSRQLQNIASLDATTTATIEAAIANGPNTFTDITVSGVSTFVGLATFNSGLQVVSGVTTLGVTTATDLTLQQLSVSGVSTLGTLEVNAGVLTATSGIITYYGDGQYLQNILSGVGIATAGGTVGTGATILDFRGAGISTVTVSSGVATINITGGGSGSASIGIGTTPGEAFTGIVTAGNLWYNSNLGRMFIYYQDNDSAQWVDASPTNIGIITSLTNVSFAAGSATSPSMYFVGDQQTGFFSPGAGEFTVVSTGSSVLNINSSGIRVTGIATAQDFDALSDVRYKENINTVNSALLKVEQLRGVKFNWKESGLPSYGVIAQELEEVLPELVHGEDPKTVNYNGIIGVLIEAIKELKAEIEELKNTK